MQKKQTLVSSKKFSIRAHCWFVWNRLALLLLWILIGLQAVGMHQFIAEEMTATETSASVVLVDSQLAGSTPKVRTRRLANQVVFLLKKPK